MTIPNAITAARLAATPYVAKRVREDPGGWWWKAGLIAASDNLDGILARLEDNSDRLAHMGFRRSEIGRKLDPITDKLFGANILVAGIRGGTIPKWLGGISLIQKAAVSVVSLKAEKEGKEVHVSNIGKYGEFVTNVGVGLLLATDTIADDKTRSIAHRGAEVLTVAGIGMATIAAAGYMKQAHESSVMIDDQA